jgi:hypothetical protein
MVQVWSAILNLPTIIWNNPRCGGGQREPQKIWGRLPVQPCPAFSFPTECVAATWFRVYSMPPEPDNFAVPHFSLFWMVCSGRESQEFFDAPAAHRHTGRLF